MKKSTLITMLLTLVFILTGFSACVAPSDNITKEEVKKTKPVDLSGLSETELDKIKPGLIDILKDSDKDDNISVTIFLSSVIESSEVKRLANERISQYDISYNKAVKQIFDETNTPIIQDVIADYNLKVPHESLIATSVMCIGCTSANAQTVIEMTKDTRVSSIHTSSVSYEDIVAEIDNDIPTDAFSDGVI